MLMRNSEHGLLRSVRTGVHEVHDRTLVAPDDCSVRIRREIANRCGVPMIPASKPALAIHSLLHDGPLACSAHEKSMQVQLKTVSNGIVVDSGGQPAGTHQGCTTKI